MKIEDEHSYCEYVAMYFISSSLNSLVIIRLLISPTSDGPRLMVPGPCCDPRIMIPPKNHFRLRQTFS